MKLRKHTNDTANITYEEEAMSKQAKTLTAEELRRVLDHVATRITPATKLINYAA